MLIGQKEPGADFQVEGISRSSIAGVGETLHGIFAFCSFSYFEVGVVSM